MPLKQIYNYDFAQMSTNQDFKAFRNKFFAKTLSLAELKIIHDHVQNSEITIAGKTIKSAIYLKSAETNNIAPFVVLAQLHGNEPAGLAGIALAMALCEIKLLKRDVIGIIGNPLAARQYFEAWEKKPTSPQETRDAFRCGLDKNGELLPDGNRIPVNFLDDKAPSAHTKRAQELWHLGQNISGILDIHSARGNMTCVTECKNDKDLQYSPIRAVLINLAEAISANASATVTVKTLKTILSPLTNITCQTGIEAGRHEDPKSPYVAASFTLATLYNKGITAVKPFMGQDDGTFISYSVKPRITYADLICEGKLQTNDQVYMAREVRDKIEEYQYDEMEAIAANQVVAIAKPSGTVFRAPFAFSGIFLSKSKKLYDKDPSVGPWPISADDISKIKFCYPCIVSEMKITF